MPYISNTDKEREVMLREIGVENFEQLVSHIPANLKLQKELQLDQPVSEIEITSRIHNLAAKNYSSYCINSFLGGGIYDHFIPAAVDHVISRPEFYTAYTPYQAEVSQGTLQAIFEYQTMICELTGMEISNAGMYDGASAAAEAVLMACRKTKNMKALISGTVNPSFLDVIRIYTEGIGVELVTIPEKDGVTDIEALKTLIDDKTACVLVQTPNFLGNIENTTAIEPVVHSVKKALYISAVDPISLAVMKTPASYNADIVIGEGQALGNKPNYGGPLFGFFASKMDLARMMPGRIVGGTEDLEGKRAFALTLQAREQHIRREKATSNICSNEALCTLAATVWMSLMGREGLKEIAVQSTTKAHYLANEITKLNGFSMAYQQPFFKEFAIKTPVPVQCIIDKLQEKYIFAGINLSQYNFGEYLMIAVTEKKSKADMDAFVKALSEVTNG